MKAFQKWLITSSSLLTGITGVLYFWMKRFYVPDDPFAVSHPLEPLVLKAHILAAPVLVFALGLVTTDHIWRNYRCLVPVGRRSGLAAAAMIVPMIATGYLIQAVTSAGWLAALGWAHLGAGLLYLGGLAAHQQVFRRGRRAAGTFARERWSRVRGLRLRAWTSPPSEDSVPTTPVRSERRGRRARGEVRP